MLVRPPDWSHDQGRHINPDSQDRAAKNPTCPIVVLEMLSRDKQWYSEPVAHLMSSVCTEYRIWYDGRVRWRDHVNGKV
jgi:hypothetical protein